MATKNIQMNLYNGSDYDILYPQTTAAQASAVPTTRTVNGKALSSNISLTASDVSALPLTGGTISGNLTLKGSGNYGTQLNLGDGDFVHIAEPKDDIMEIKAKKVNIVTSDTSSAALTWNGSAIGGGGISTPVSIANGGTGSSSASSAVYNLLNGLSTRSASQVNSYNSSTYLGGYYGSTGYKIPISSLLTYIQNNASGSGGSNALSALSYTGTGTNSSSSPAQVTFPTRPKFIWFIDGFVNSDNLGNTENITSYPTTFTQTTSVFGGSLSGMNVDGFIKWSGNTMYWYNAKITNTTGPVYGGLGALYNNNNSGIKYNIVYY